MNSGQRSKSVSTAQTSRGGRGTSDAAAESDDGSAADTLRGTAGAPQTPPPRSTPPSRGGEGPRRSPAGAPRGPPRGAPPPGRVAAPAPPPPPPPGPPTKGGGARP